MAWMRTRPTGAGEDRAPAMMWLPIAGLDRHTPIIGLLPAAAGSALSDVGHRHRAARNLPADLRFPARVAASESVARECGKQ